VSRRDLLLLPSALLALGLTCCAPDVPVRPSGGDEKQSAGLGVTSSPPLVVPHFTVRGRWDDPRQLTYRIEDRVGPIDAEAFGAAITRACAVWTETGLVAFSVAEVDASPDVVLGWRRGHHGACEPFSADSAVAHSGPVRSGTFVHFDAGRKWVADAEHDRDGYSLYGTALHELGHVLGLGHSTATDAVMRTGVVRSAPLAASDLLGLQSLYGGGVDAVGDLRIETAKGERLAVLRGVAPGDISDFAVFDVDGNDNDEVMVWRTDRSGNGQLMIYHFGKGAQLVRTTGPFVGTMASGAKHLLMHTASGHRVLHTAYENGHRIAHYFDKYGVPKGFSVDLIGEEEMVAAEQAGNARVGDLDGDGSRESVVPVQ